MGSRIHRISRDDGHYFGNCIAFDPPGIAPVGMDNKVKNNSVFQHLKTNILSHSLKLD